MIDIPRGFLSTGSVHPNNELLGDTTDPTAHRNPSRYLQRIKNSGANLLEEVSEVEMVALTMLVIGSALGLRFRIFVLLPVILLGIFVCTAFGLAQGTTIWSIMLTSVVGATCLQLGYLGGALLKFLIFGARFDGTNGSQSARPFAG